MFILKKEYFFIIESINELKFKNIKKLNKFSIIYRNDNTENISKLKLFRLNCKNRKIPFFVANNISLMNTIKADGLYISAYNKSLNIRKIKRNNYKIIGAAHNIKEVNLKKLQGCSKIFFSRLFKTNYKNKKGFLGIIRFNLIARLINTSLIPLGGINLNNISKLNLVSSEGVAFSSIMKNNPSETLKILR